jgi:hypothetical protein
VAGFPRGTEFNYVSALLKILNLLGMPTQKIMIAVQKILHQMQKGITAGLAVSFVH